MNILIDIDPKTIEAWRKELKKHRGSINLVASKAGLKHSNVSMMLSGKRKVSDSSEKFLIAIKDVLNEIAEKKQNQKRELKSIKL